MKKPEEIREIAVTRLQCIGDMLVFVPALRALRQLCPRAKITLLAKHRPGIEVIERSPYIDRLLVIGDRSWREKFRIIRAFRHIRPDLFLVSTLDQGKVPWARLGGARRIAAYPAVDHRGRVKKEKWRWAIDAVPDYSPEVSDIELNVRLVMAGLGLEGQPLPDLSCEYSWFRPETPAKVDARLAGLKRPLVAVGAVTREAERNWGEERFLRLFHRLHEEFGAEVLLTGGPAEREECLRLAADAEWIRALAGEFSLDESAWMLKQCDLFVGSDSGPGHLAAAVGCPSVIFNRQDSIGRWHHPAPAAPRRELVAADNVAASIPESEVLAACRELLAGTAD